MQGGHIQTRSLDKLMERIRKATELCLEVEGDVPHESLLMCRVDLCKSDAKVSTAQGSASHRRFIKRGI